jgi:glycosyltransferase involved in cell wall biosynthesis
MKKIIFPFIGDSVGGAQISALNLIGNLDADEYAPVIVLHEIGRLSEYLDNKKINYTILPLPKYAGSEPNVFRIAHAIFVTLPKLITFLKKYQPNLVHCNDLRCNLTWMMPTRLSGIAFIWHQRTSFHSRSLLWKLIPIISSHIIAISTTAAAAFGVDNLKLRIISNPIEVIPRSDRSEARRKIVNSLGFEGSDKIIGCVGRLTPSKRPELCLNILSLLIEKHRIPAQVIFCGHGRADFIDKIDRAAKEHELRERVHFMGFCDNISEMISGFDVLIAPSSMEGFGRTLVEAMLLETPVVASGIAAHREFLTDQFNGIIFEDNDLIDCVNHIKRLLVDSLYSASLTRRAYLTVMNGYRPRDHVINIQRLYNDLLNVAN